MDDKYYCSVDFLRIFFCLCVIVGHIYIILGLGNDSEVIITMQNMSVDSFFIISGLFMAQSCNKLLNSSDESTSKEYIFLKYQYKTSIVNRISIPNPSTCWFMCYKSI